MKPIPSPAAPAVPSWAPALLGVFLGIALLKFGNPVILDAKVAAPAEFADVILESWPPRWAFPIFACIAVAIVVFSPIVALLRQTTTGRGVAVAGMAWLGWEFLAAQRSVDPVLSRLTLPHFAGVLASFLLGWLVISKSPRRGWIFAGLGIAVIFCWLRAVNQHVVEFPQDHAMLLEGQQVGWTNFPPSAVEEMRRNGMIVRTNGLDAANPAILDKLRRGRSFGTLVYPNALASCVLLLLPPLLAIGVSLGSQLRPALSRLAIALIALLGGLALFWSGSKSGWLIGLGMIVIAIIRHPSAQKYRGWMVAGVLAAGLAVFAVRFSGYFSRGATSVSARMDYWKAAVRIAKDQPVWGTGPGTFQRPYAKLKHPDAEMARLVHNDFLEQFSDSGIPGGLFYLAWVGGSLALVWRRWPTDRLWSSVALGVTGWMAQGTAEFSLYVPGLSWAAFAALGMLASGPAPAGMASTDGLIVDKIPGSK